MPRLVPGDQELFLVRYERSVYLCQDMPTAVLAASLIVASLDRNVVCRGWSDISDFCNERGVNIYVTKAGVYKTSYDAAEELALASSAVPEES